MNYDQENALVKANVVAAIKKAAESRVSIVPALLLRKGDVEVKIEAPTHSTKAVGFLHKIHNHTTGEWRVESDDGVVLGKFATEAEADALIKGDLPGHEFHGNQHTKVAIGHEKEMVRIGTQNLTPEQQKDFVRHDRQAKLHREAAAAHKTAATHIKLGTAEAAHYSRVAMSRTATLKE